MTDLVVSNDLCFFPPLDNLKISDFGLATVFRHQGRERTLDTCCGTVPYVAPEVIQKKPYNAEPVDIWSCGIILVALLAGGRLYLHGTFQDLKDLNLGFHNLLFNYYIITILKCTEFAHHIICDSVSKLILGFMGARYPVNFASESQ